MAHQPNDAVSDMKDEYGIMDSSGQTFSKKDFMLESGTVMKVAEVSLQGLGVTRSAASCTCTHGTLVAPCLMTS